MKFEFEAIPLSINDTKELTRQISGITYNGKDVIVDDITRRYLMSGEEASYLIDFIEYYILVPQTIIKRVINE